MSSNGAGLLSGRLALITGAGSGIGKATCEVFAREGAVIAAVDINKDNAEKVVKSLPAGIEHRAFYADVSSSADVQKVIQDVQSAFNRAPTIGVNCAGIVNELMIHEISEEIFDRTVGVNLKGTFLVTQMLTKAQVDNNLTDCSVINISSITGKCGHINTSHYSATKGGIIAFSKSLAKELASKGVRVNSILPGLTDTPLLGPISEKMKKQVEAEIPIGRLGQPQEVANVCLFLASDMSSYVTGASIEVTGGLWM